MGLPAPGVQAPSATVGNHGGRVPARVGTEVPAGSRPPPARVLLCRNLGPGYQRRGTAVGVCHPTAQCAASMACSGGVRCPALRAWASDLKLCAQNQKVTFWDSGLRTI